MAIPAWAIALLFVGGVAAVTYLWWQLDVERVRRARTLLERGAKLICVDPPELYECDHPRGSINVPLDDLPALADQLDRSKPIIVYGHHTLRAMTATRELVRRGFRVLTLGPARPDWTGI